MLFSSTNTRLSWQQAILSHEMCQTFTQTPLFSKTHSPATQMAFCILLSMCICMDSGFLEGIVGLQYQDHLDNGKWEFSKCQTCSPQASPVSLRGSTVFISTKNAPLWMARRWDMSRIRLRWSNTTVNPEMESTHHYVITTFHVKH